MIISDNFLNKSFIFLDTRSLLKMASGDSSETLVPIYQTTRRYSETKAAFIVTAVRISNMPLLTSGLLQRYNTSLTGSLLFDKTVSPAGYEVLTVTIESAIDSYIRYGWGGLLWIQLEGKLKLKGTGVRVNAIKLWRKSSTDLLSLTPRY